MDVYVLIKAEQMPWAETLGVYSTLKSAQSRVIEIEPGKTPRWVTGGDVTITETHFAWDRRPSDVEDTYTITRFTLVQ